MTVSIWALSLTLQTLLTIVGKEYIEELHGVNHRDQTISEIDLLLIRLLYGDIMRLQNLQVYQFLA